MSIAYLPTITLSYQLAKFGAALLSNRWISSWRNRYRLKDSQRVQVKPIQQEDFEAILEILAGLGPESSYLRFGQMQLQNAPARMQRMAERIASEANTVGQGWIAYSLGVDGEATPVGMARYVTLPGQQAEVAFTVIDAYQGLGLGSILWKKVARSAKHAKFSQLIAHVHPQNYRMQSLISKSGLPVSTDFGTQTLSITMSL